MTAVSSTAATGNAILRAVLENPADDFPRLAYADWCEENGDAARAELIHKHLLGLPLWWGVDALDYHAQRWCPWFGTVSLVVRVYDDGDERRQVRVMYKAGAVTVWRRGFIERVEMPSADFLEHAEALFSAHPVEEVTLAGRRPHLDGYGGFFWVAGDGGGLVKIDDRHVPVGTVRACLPEGVFALLREAGGSGTRGRRYESEALALADLSNACVAYGRRLAGLAR